MVEMARRTPFTREPVKGENREELIGQCSDLVNECSGKFDSDSWRELTSCMVDLLGGETNAERNATTTPWLIDEQGYAINFSSLIKSDLVGEHCIEETRVIIRPAWTVLPETRLSRTESYLEEMLETGYGYMQEPSVTRLSRTLIFPNKKANDMADSYVENASIRLNVGHEFRSESEETLATNEQLKELARRILQTFTSGKAKIQNKL